MTSIEALRRAIQTATTDDLSEPGSDKRLRHIARLAAMGDAIGEIERTTEQLRDIRDWCAAYPISALPEPDLKKCQEALEGAGLSVGALHASWARHLLSGISWHALAGLGLPEAETIKT